MSTFDAIKDPEAVLDYTIDWSPWLPDTDIIITSSWSLDPSGGSLTIAAESDTATTATVWLSGGERRRKYKVINHILTQAGREDDRTILLEIQDK
jgi:hypothetical protein